MVLLLAEKEESICASTKYIACFSQASSAREQPALAAEHLTLSRAFSSSLCGMLVHVRCIMVSTQTCRAISCYYTMYSRAWAPWLHKLHYSPACRVVMECGSIPSRGALAWVLQGRALKGIYAEAGAHHVLHLGSNVQCKVRRGATGAPGDVAEGGSKRRHAVLPIEQVLHTL